jgi:hypothetical protein
MCERKSLQIMFKLAPKPQSCLVHLGTPSTLCDLVCVVISAKVCGNRAFPLRECAKTVEIVNVLRTQASPSGSTSPFMRRIRAAISRTRVCEGTYPYRSCSRIHSVRNSS